MKFKSIFISGWFILGAVLFITPFLTQAQNATFAEETGVVDNQDEAVIYMLGRDDCGFCRAQKEWMDTEDVPYVYLNILTDDYSAELYDQVVEKHGLTKVTPISVVGESVFLGWNSERSTGVSMLEALERTKSGDIRTVEQHLEFAPRQDAVSQGGCSGLECEGNSMEFVFDLPFVGVVDLKTFSLFTLSALLGVIDGFNPCAMWVLVTFLVLLSQAGSRKKMIFLAGLFILAEGLMYNLILNVWYQAWDFVALDQIVTPLVGALATGGGLFFLWRWYKNRDTALVCDISSIDSQSRTINKFQAIVNQPITIASIAAILVIAFSVNVIEFACSIGIPQAYTKILELNDLTFLQRQWYLMVFTIGYMIDDVIVFGLAIWGYDKLQSHGQKYAQYSLLVGGVLMLILGLVLVINPGLLVL